MAKNILQDIVPPEKRSIRNIPIPNKSNRTNSFQTDVKQIKQKEEFFEMPKHANSTKEIFQPKKSKEPVDALPHAYPYEDGEIKVSFFSSRKKAILIAVGLAIVIVGLAISSLFNGATVTVVPKGKQAVASTQTVFTAKKEATAGELGFQILTIAKTAGKEVAATGEEKVERKASGTITVFNSTDTSQQRLIKNTRFETPEGLIYRVNESVVIPGSITVAGKVIPGSVDVTVHADEAGEKYNVGKKDFTIPGFKGDPRFKTVYARSKTDMTNGFIGTVKKVSDSDAAKAKGELHATLAEQLKKDVESQLPADFIVFDDGLFYSYTSLAQTGGSNSSATINEEGILRAIIFNRSSFAKQVAQTIAPTVANTDVAMLGVEGLAFAIKDKTTLDSTNLTTLSFTLTGTINFLSQFDENKLKTDLTNKKRGDLSSILQNYPSIKQANAVIRPFWKSTFPSEDADIKITIAPENN